MESTLPAIAFAVLVLAQVAAVIALQIQGDAELYFSLRRPNSSARRSG